MSSKSQQSSSGKEGPSSASVASFCRLPQELRTMILELTCYRQPQSRKDGTTSKSWHWDPKTAASLATVSRTFHSIVQPILYAHVKLNRPSTLASFYASLVSRPSNAALVKSIHLGPLSGLGEGWWPLLFKEKGSAELNMRWLDDDRDDEIVLLKTSLTRRDELLSRLPRWAKPESAWAYQLQPGTCQEQAVAAAIYTAIRVLDMSPSLRFVEGYIEFVDLDEWTMRLFEVQAVLDLYLCAMRQIDDQEGRTIPSWRSTSPPRKSPEKCRTGHCGHYPTLKLVGFEEGRVMLRLGQQRSKTSAQGEGAIETSDSLAQEKGEEAEDSKGAPTGTLFHRADCVITREQVNEHLMRHGAYTDQFEHPLVYARSKLRMLAFNDDYKLIIDPYEEHTNDFYMPESSEMGSVSEGHHSCCGSYGSMSEESESGGRHSKSKIKEPLDHGQQEGLFGLARSTLRLTTRVTNLAVTGSFSCLTREELPVLQTLRFLSVGPLSPLASIYAWLWDMKLLALEQLRVCGDIIGTGIACKIAGQDKNQSMPKLREVQWDLGQCSIKWSSEPYRKPGLLEVLNALQGRPEEGAAAQRESSTKTSAIPPSDQNSLQDDDPQRSMPPRRHIEVRIPPALFAQMNESILSPEVRGAWVHGTPMEDAPHVLHVLETRAMKHVTDWRGVEKVRQDIGVLRRDSRLWWEERAMECDGGRI